MSVSQWIYNKAFCRNLGLISPSEQERLRNSRVAIAGMGGVGGIDLIALARLGIGAFTIADPDTFEVQNSNRQYGAMVSNQGKNKAEVMAAILRDINPEVDVRIFKDAISEGNATDFLMDADIFVDGIDAFEIDTRRLIYGLAREQGIYALGAGPVGFSTAWTIFSPSGMTFDSYFDLSDSQTGIEKFASYILGVAPASGHRGYMDIAYVDIANHIAPSSGAACHLASGVIAVEVLKILLQRGPIYPAPYYQQFDAYLGKFTRGRLLFGNRSPLQRFKRHLLLKFINRRKSNG